jgi:hypothetical protein
MKIIINLSVIVFQLVWLVESIIFSNHESDTGFIIVRIKQVRTLELLKVALKGNFLERKLDSEKMQLTNSLRYAIPP